MKSRFFFNAVLISLAAAFVLPLFSCSDASNDVGSGMVSFYVDKALMQKAVELSDKVSKNPNDEPRGESERRLRFVATLEGEYNETKTVYAPYEGDFGFESFSIDFAAVPVGKTICAKIRIYNEYTQEPVEERPRPSVYGKSQNIRVNSGVNPLAVEACSYQVDVRVKIEIQFDQRPDFSICSAKYIYAVDPMSSFVAKLNNAKDDLRRYEVCNQFVDKYWDDCLGEIALTQENTSFSDDGKTVTVEGDMSLCVSEDDPASRAADARFVLLGQNISYDAGNYSYKTKFYGMTSSTVIPIKGRENIVEFSAKSLGVVDTSLAMYKIADSEYKYYLTEDASDSLVGDSDVSSSGVSGSIGSYAQSSCFDAAGRFYSLSITPSEGSVRIKSNNPNITSPGESDGTYKCQNETGGWINYNSIACDTTNNELFMFMDRGDNIYVLYGTGDFLASGNNADVAYQLDISHAGIDFRSFDRKNFSVYDGTAYFVARSSAGKPYILKADLSKKTEAASSDYDYKVDFEILAEIPLPNDVEYGVDNAEFTDLVYQGGSVYLLFNESCDNIRYRDYSMGLYYKSRGALIKYDVSKKTVKTIGWTDGAQDNADANFVTYYRSNGYTYNYFIANCSPDWTDESKWFRISGNTSASWHSGGGLIRDSLPKIYSPSLAAASDAFYGPQKIIGIKPKKLVIADNGTAFYTDANSGYYYCKNARRIVTVDLESFSISSVVDNAAAFETVLNETIYTSAFGNINAFVSIIPDSSEGLYINNGSKFTPSSQGDYSVYLGIPLVE